jgi:AraC family transcriptional regulator
MYWIKEMQSAIRFIEDRLTEELSIEEIASSANSSSANFQRIFTIVTGMTVGDYIRSRRLSLAGKDLAESGAKVIDTAIKFGFETAESFTKAFTRFHGVTPSAAKQQKSGLKYFAALYHC